MLAKPHYSHTSVLHLPHHLSSHFFPFPFPFFPAFPPPSPSPPPSRSSNAFSASTFASYSTSSTHCFAKKKCHVAAPTNPRTATMLITLLSTDHSVILAKYLSQGVTMAFLSSWYALVLTSNTISSHFISSTWTRQERAWETYLQIRIHAVQKRE